MVRKDELREYGPERLGGQGLDIHQHESGDRTILALLVETPAADQVDLVATWRDDAYEVWSRLGMIRFKCFADQNGALAFGVIDQISATSSAHHEPFIVS